MFRSSISIARKVALGSAIVLTALSHSIMAATQTYTVDLVYGNDQSDGIHSALKTVTAGVAKANAYAAGSSSSFAIVQVNALGNNAPSSPQYITSTAGEIFPLQLGTRVTVRGNTADPALFVIQYKAGNSDYGVKLKGDGATIEGFTIDGFGTMVNSTGVGASGEVYANSLIFTYAGSGSKFIKAESGLITANNISSDLFASWGGRIELWSADLYINNSSLFLSSGIRVSNGDLTIVDSSVGFNDVLLTANGGSLVNIYDSSLSVVTYCGGPCSPTLDRSKEAIVLTSDAFMSVQNSDITGDDLWVIHAKDSSAVRLGEAHIARIGVTAGNTINDGGAIRIDNSAILSLYRLSPVDVRKNEITIDGGTGIYVSPGAPGPVIDWADFSVERSGSGLRLGGSLASQVDLDSVTFKDFVYGIWFNNLSDASKIRFSDTRFSTSHSSGSAIRLSACASGAGSVDVTSSPYSNYFFPSVQGANSSGRYTSGSKTISGPTSGSLLNFSMESGCSVKVRN